MEHAKNPPTAHKEACVGRILPSRITLRSGEDALVVLKTLEDIRTRARAAELSGGAR